MSRFRFERIYLAIVVNQPVASESERALDRCRSADVTPPVNMLQIVSIVVSTLAVFRLFTGRITNSARLQTQPVTPVRDTSLLLKTGIATMFRNVAKRFFEFVIAMRN